MLTLLLLLSCAPVVHDESTPGAASDPTDAAYDLDHLLQVEIELDPADWAALRAETRDFNEVLGQEDCQADAYGSPFHWYPATVTLDGEVLSPVDVRKKGFLGSLSWERPALKLDLGEYEDLSFHGVRRLTLNNSLSDPAVVRQCAGYGFFADAGLPASRCSLAHVTVNGEDLGDYVNVEPIKEPMLGRYFAQTDGNLYEGTLSDFREGWTGTFEKKSNEGQDDWSDIDAVVEAAQAPDDELLDALSATIDLDAFLTHWAAEVLLVHLDGYAWNTNNYYLYDDPATGLLRFIPWGIDAILSPAQDGVPASVYAYGVLAHRLYALPQGRELYEEHLQTLLAGAWDEDTLISRVDRMEAVLGDDAPVDEIASVRDVILSRRGDIEAELVQGPPEWDTPMRDSFCFQTLGEGSASFSAVWGTADTEDPFSTGSGAMELSFEDDTWELPSAGAVAGESEDQAVLFLAGWLSGTEAVVIYVVAPPEQFTPGTIELGFGESMGALYYIDTRTMEDFEFVSYVIGEARFDQAGTGDGDPIVGELSGELMSWGI